MNRKAACLHRWCFSPTSRRRPTGSVSVRRLSPCRWKIRCASPKTRRYWIYSPTDVWRWVLPGGTPTSFLPFGLTSEQRGAAFADHLHLIHGARRGDTLSHPDNRLYPPAPQLAERIWIATFSAEGAIRAGQAGHGLMLSRTQPRPPGEPRLPLDAIQNPIIDAHRGAAGRRCAADPRLAHRLRRRQSRPRPAGRRARSAQAGNSAPGGGSYDRR